MNALIGLGNDIKDDIIKVICIFTHESKYKSLLFGWQHLELDLDLKSIDLKCLNLKSLDFKVPCLGLFKQRMIWNSSFEISLFEYLNLDLDLDLRSINYIL